jgi:hypothetical protein
MSTVSCLPPSSELSRGFLIYLRTLPNYALNYTFEELRAILLDYIRINYPDWTDFAESSSGMMLMEIVAYATAMFGYKVDYTTKQFYLDSVSSLDVYTKMALLTGIKISLPSCSFLYQTDSNNNFINLRFSRTENDTSAITIAPGTKFTFSSGQDKISYEIFEVNTDYTLNYTALLSDNPTNFVVIPANSLNSDMSTSVDAPVSKFAIVEGRSVPETFYSNGKPNQKFQLSSFPVCQDPLSGFRVGITVQNSQTGLLETDWKEVDSLIYSTTTDKHFELEWDGSFKMTIKFGNSAFGVIPPMGSAIKVVYRVGGGAHKSIRKGSLKIAVPAYRNGSFRTNALLENFIQTFGGSEGDTLEKAKYYHPFKIRSQNRLVSGEDFAYFASNFSGIAKAKAYLVDNDATGNLIKLLIVNYQSTEEGYLRPIRGTENTKLRNSLDYNIIQAINYNSSTETTSIRLLYPLARVNETNDFYVANRNELKKNGTSNETPLDYVSMISAKGVSKEFDMVLTPVNDEYLDITIPEDVTNIFSSGDVVGCYVMNDPNYMLQLSSDAPETFNYEGLDVGKLGTLEWPGGTDNFAIVQMDNELLQVASTPYYKKTTDSSGNITYETSYDAYKYLNIISRGYQNTQISSHLEDSIINLGGVRPDLYRAIDKYKVGVNETLILEGDILPVYMLLKIKVSSYSNYNLLMDKIRLSIEDYFNLTNTRWGLGKDMEISPLISAIQGHQEVKSILYEHATQYIINSTNPSLSNYIPISVEEDITGVPDTHIIGLLPYKAAIAPLNQVLSTDQTMTYYLKTDIAANNEVESITLDDQYNSDLSLLPEQGIIRIENEFIAYQKKISNVLYGITRNIYSSGSTTSPRAYLVSEASPIYVCPNILILLITTTENS